MGLELTHPWAWHTGKRFSGTLSSISCMPHTQYSITMYVGRAKENTQQAPCSGQDGPWDTDKCWGWGCNSAVSGSTREGSWALQWIPTPPWILQGRPVELRTPPLGLACTVQHEGPWLFHPKEELKSCPPRGVRDRGACGPWGREGWNCGGGGEGVRKGGSQCQVEALQPHLFVEKSPVIHPAGQG